MGKGNKPQKNDKKNMKPKKKVPDAGYSRPPGFPTQS